MEELIGRITRNVGLDEETARSAVGIILSFLYQQGPRDKVADLVALIPGAAAFVETGSNDDAATLGGLGGLMGGGVMAVLGELQGLGLGMGQIQGVTQETVDYAREKGGDDLINEIAAAIPGLGQFI